MQPIRLRLSPYLRAWHAYHDHGLPGWSWDEILTQHFHHGTIISTPETFIAARRVNHADPDAFHVSPLQWRPDGDTWMIWIAAGRLEPLARLLEAHPSQWVSFHRRDSTRLRRIPSSIFLRHGFTQNAKAASPSASPCPAERPGASGR